MEKQQFIWGCLSKEQFEKHKRNDVGMFFIYFSTCLDELLAKSEAFNIRIRIPRWVDCEWNEANIWEEVFDSKKIAWKKLLLKWISFLSYRDVKWYEWASGVVYSFDLFLRVKSGSGSSEKMKEI
jgi:hypothetical protein